MIALTSVTKVFGSHTAVDDITLHIEKGEYFALLGPNGAGKTTIVRLLLGFIQPHTGTITINGIPVSDPQSRTSIGYLAERHKIPPYLTGYQYLSRHASLAGLTGGQADKEISRALEMVSMKGKEKRKSSTYSKGMIQRMGLAAALLGKPELLILDEPITGLDPIGVREVRTILEHLHQDSVTILLNSHLLSEVEKICESIGIIHKGKILVKGPLESIIQDKSSLEDVFIDYIERDNA